MSNGGRLQELIRQHDDLLNRIEEGWIKADETMLGFQAGRMGRETGGYEKIAAYERQPVGIMIAKYHDKIVLPLLRLVGEPLKLRLIEFADRLHKDISDPRCPWSDLHSDKKSVLLRLLDAAMPAHNQPAQKEWSRIMLMKEIAALLGLSSTARRRAVEPRLKAINSELWVMEEGGFRVRVDTMDPTYREKFTRKSW